MMSENKLRRLLNRRYTIYATLLIIALTYGFQTYAYPKLTLFREDKVVDNFRHMDQIFPSVSVRKSEEPLTLPKQITPLTISYRFNGQSKSLAEFLERSQTTGFLVIHNDKIINEQYFKGYQNDDRMTSFSVAKSFISTLVGIALEDGLIENLKDPISDYVDSLKDTAFDGVPIIDILQMSSGVDFSEDYNDTSTDAFTIYDKMFVWLRSIDRITADFPKKEGSGSRFQYASINTQALGMLIKSVTGKPVSDYLETKIWRPMGAISDALWLTDLHGNEISFFGLNATLVDFAKLGLLYLHQGEINGRRIVSETWIKRATTPDKPYLQPGEIDEDWGYQFQWWIPKDADGEFVAIGIWGQFIYINTKTGTVIVKTSADKHFKPHEFEAITVFRQIASFVSSS